MLKIKCRYFNIFCLVVITLSLFFSSACSNKASVYVPDKFSIKDLSVYTAKDRKPVTYGMSKEEVEKVVGKPLDDSQTLSNSFSYKGCTILYRDNKAVLISVLSEDNIHEISLITNRDIKLGDSSGDIALKYGDETMATANDITFCFQKKNSSMTLLQTNDLNSYSTDSTDIYFIDFYVNRNNNTVSSITIGDRKAISLLR